jgi:hypothetical protein
MKFRRTAIALSLGLLLSGPVFAQQGNDHANEQTRKELKADAKQQKKADKAQAKADKAREKALGSGKVKDAARKQDKANAAQPQ